MALVILVSSVRTEAKRLVEKLPKVSYVLEEYSDRNKVKERLKESDMHIIEGIWKFPSDGATVAIERYVKNGIIKENSVVNYRMVIIRSPQRSVRPGTVMGHIAPTSKKGVYSASIYTSSDGGSHLFMPNDFTLTLNDDGHLSFKKNSFLRIGLSAWKLIPYLSRIRVRAYGTNDAPRDLDGCVRIFPMSVDGPVEPRYL